MKTEAEKKGFHYILKLYFKEILNSRPFFLFQLHF